ncbi:MAG: TM2 domain-containing protein [Cyanobacteria bacterium NC_groundwater_1444_Ag_S-0.65um_54_12]|nr:TM2 domain-containing protein [Cyanobacteria bacterium NC_groundwater_1444_Ag_S-0.65um_54_12]
MSMPITTIKVIRRLLWCLALASGAFQSADAWAMSPTKFSPAATLSAATDREAATDRQLTSPNLGGAFLSLLLPGAGQFYLGDNTKGIAYLASGGILAGATFIYLRSQRAGDFDSFEMLAFPAVISLAGYLAVGMVSTIDALLALQPGPTAAEPVSPLPQTAVQSPIMTLAVPGAKPATAKPTPAPTAPPVTVSSTMLPLAAPEPIATLSPTKTIEPPDDGQYVIAAYQLAKANRYAAAIAELDRISDPEYGPKIEALSRQWGTAAAKELLKQTESLLAAEQYDAADSMLGRILRLPVSSVIQKQAQELRTRILSRKKSP